jgi:hypothetical protein
VVRSEEQRLEHHVRVIELDQGIEVTAVVSREPSLTLSTLFSDIAYSDSPAASRASA